MFDIGLGELAIIAFVALIFLGPGRCTRLFGKAGRWLKKIEAEWDNARKTLE